MIPLEQLRYVRLPVADIKAAADFAQRILGLEPAGRSERLAYFRSDFRDHTLVYVTDAARPAIGLEVHDADALDQARAAIEQEGIAVHGGDGEACAERRVKAMLAFTRGDVDFEIVVRPLHSGWRYFPSRDAGITGLHAVSLRSRQPEADERFWTRVFSARVTDRIGDGAYLALDAAHHRLAIHSSQQSGVLAVEFAVESIDQVMQSSHFLATAQVSVRHGPGRRPTSNEIFVTFEGPGSVLYSYVTEGTTPGAAHRPRQFPHRPQSYCAWGSECHIREFAGDDVGRTP